MKIAFVTDAWRPQVNGVVRTSASLVEGIARAGHQVETLTPNLFPTFPCPTEPQIRLALGAHRAVAARLDRIAPDTIHIATEGPLGLAARAFCRKRSFRFTSSYHTKYPEYLRDRFGLPTGWGYVALRRFHAPSSAVMVATESVRRELVARGFERVVLGTRGVDTELFRPGRAPR